MSGECLSNPNWSTRLIIPTFQTPNLKAPPPQSTLLLFYLTINLQRHTQQNKYNKQHAIFSPSNSRSRRTQTQWRLQPCRQSLKRHTLPSWLDGRRSRDWGDCRGWNRSADCTFHSPAILQRLDGERIEAEI